MTTSVRRALVSVSNKEGVAEFARGLAALGVEILSTGGTAALLREKGIPVTEVSAYTGFPEIMDGRVKTLHPKIHGGILAIRDNPAHTAQAAQHGIRPIDLVAVNLYQFRETVAKPGVTYEEAVEQIDIGGPSMVRAAAKNHHDVAIVVDPGDYGPILDEMRKSKGVVSEPTRRALALKAFRHTAGYDAAIAAWLGREVEGEGFPESLHVTLHKAVDLRYGENPHQKAALYRFDVVSGTGAGAGTVAHASIRGGKEVSYNNLLDLESAWQLAREFDQPAVVIVKHNNPCGVGYAGDLASAFRKAQQGDPVSAYGGIVAVNRPVDTAMAELMAAKDQFFEAIVAPKFPNAVVEILTTKPKWGKNLRILEAGEPAPVKAAVREIRSLEGGALVQTKDDTVAQEWKSVTTEPTQQQNGDLLLAWKTAKHVKSNAIVLAKEGMVVGVGAGQMSRLDSVMIAARKAGDRAKGSALASDAFFPFKDGLEAALDAGVTSVVQPGGSIRDDEVIGLAKARGVPMILTKMRHFRH